MPNWNTRDIPSQAGKLALVTGATGGLGYETALELARAGAEVVLLGRNEAKGGSAVERLQRALPSAALRFERLDLASLVSVNACADVLLSGGRAVDLLVNNAGVMAIPTRKTTVDGFEMQFATNHLGHLLLTSRLLPLLRRNPGSRVVTVSSLMHRMGTMDFDNLQAERRYSPNRAYGQSKLANLLFACELQRRSILGRWGVISVAAHPGASNTDLVANGPGADGAVGAVSAIVVRLIGQSAAAGALPTLFAGTAPDAEPGGYYGPNGSFELKGAPAPASISPKAKDSAVAGQLWDVSVQLTGATWPNPEPTGWVTLDAPDLSRSQA